MSQKIMCKVMAASLSFVIVPLQGGDSLQAFKSGKLPCVALAVGSLGSVGYALYQKNKCSKLATQFAENTSWHQEKEDLQQRIREKNQTIDGHERRIATLNEQLGNSNARIATLRQEKTDLEKQCRELRFQKEELEREWRNKDDRIAALSLTEKGLQEQIQNRDAELSKHKTQVERMNRELQEVYDRVQKSEKELWQFKEQTEEEARLLKKAFINALSHVSGSSLPWKQEVKIMSATNTRGLMESLDNVYQTLPTRKNLVDENRQLKSLMKRVNHVYNSLSAEQKNNLLNGAGSESDLHSEIQRVLNNSQASQEEEKALI